MLIEYIWEVTTLVAVYTKRHVLLMGERIVWISWIWFGLLCRIKIWDNVKIVLQTLAMVFIQLESTRWEKKIHYAVFEAGLKARQTKGPSRLSIPLSNRYRGKDIGVTACPSWFHYGWQTPVIICHWRQIWNRRQDIEVIWEAASHTNRDGAGKKPAWIRRTGKHSVQNARL